MEKKERKTAKCLSYELGQPKERMPFVQENVANLRIEKSVSAKAISGLGDWRAF